MATHPPAPSDFAGIVDAWNGVVQSVIDLAHTLRPDDAALGTDCPGWTVHYQVAHVVSVEALFQGEERPAIDVSHHAHVTNAFGAVVEKHLEPRRSRSLADVVEELEWRRDEALAVYRAEDVDPTSEHAGPFGPTTLEGFVKTRIFDIWFHEQDIREAIGRPGGLDSPAAAIAVEMVFDAFPRVVAKTAGIEPGNAVILEFTGPTTGRTGVRVEEQDGRARGIPLFTGSSDEHADVVTTTITTSTAAGMRIAGGRRDPSDLPVTVHGDEDVARRVLAALAITP